MSRRSPLHSPIRIVGSRRRDRALVAVAIASVLVACASSAADEGHEQPAQGVKARPPKKVLVLDDIYGERDRKVDFSGRPQTNLVWLDDDHWLWPKSDPKTRKTEWLRVEALSGKTEPFEPAAKLEKALTSVPGVDAERARSLAHQDSGAWKGGAPNALLLAITPPAKPTKPGEKRGPAAKGDLHVYRPDSSTVVQVTSTPELEEEMPELSPDGKHVAFVRGNNLYVADVDPVAEHQLTTDGSEIVLNGKLDWLYQEEVYGRGRFQSYWWSPDSRSLAFLRIDETGVPVYTLVDDVASPAKVETSPYPRAGDTNPTVKLGVAEIANGTVTWVDLSAYAGSDFLVVDVSWSPTNRLVYQVQDREQTWLDIHLGSELTDLTFGVEDGKGADSKVAEFKVVDAGADPAVVHESSPAWVDSPGSPTWLADGTFLLFSERTGWKHLYHYDANGKLIAPVTSGAWEARALRGVDEKNGWVYFTGTERSPIGADEYRVRLDGRELQRLTQEQGTHSANWNPSKTLFLDNWSCARVPTKVALRKSDGTTARVVDENPVTTLGEFELPSPEFVQVKTRDGFVMEAMLLKPTDFDPAKRYPVFMSEYAGPHSQTVRDAWGGPAGMFLSLIAQKGVVVWQCDNRTASGKGKESEWQVYKRFGETELADIEDGLAWLKQQPWVDPDRIGISGWSFGGFMASYALTHSKSFAMGIAGGTVSDWANYDSIYTERYMQTPAHNKDGYERTSVVAAAKDLHGELLLIHGELDDNVHPQNTMQLAYALQKAGKQFRLMIYPKSTHGVGDPQLVKQMRAMMLEFVEETLLRPTR